MTTTATTTEALKTTTAFVPEFRLAEIVGQIEKLARRAAKLGLPEITVRKTGKTEIRKFRHITYTKFEGEEYQNDKVIDVEAVEIEVTGVSPKLDGWQFAASIDREDAETPALFHVSPFFDGAKIPERYRSCPEGCDHCKIERYRKNTFILRHEASDTWAQIGRTCLKDYLGHDDIHSITDAAAVFLAVSEIIEGGEDFSGGFGGRGPSQICSLQEVLEIAEYVIEKHGYVSKAKKDEQELQGNYVTTTASVVREIVRLNDAQSSDDSKSLFKKYADSITEAQKAEAAAVIVWVRETLTTGDENEFLANLAALFVSDKVGFRRIGYAVAAIPSYRRHLEKLEAARREAEKPQLNEHFGVVGERITRTLTPVAFRYITTQFGDSTLVIFEDADRRTFKWFSSNCPLTEEAHKGKPVELTFSIKAHDEWQGKKQTSISRAKIFVPKADKPKWNKGGYRVEEKTDSLVRIVCKSGVERPADHSTLIDGTKVANCYTWGDLSRGQKTFSYYIAK